MNQAFTDSTVEEAAQALFEASRWQIAHGSEGQTPEFREARQ